MRLFLTASADTTLYQRYPTNNAGLDEIIEVGKVAKPEDLEIAYSSSAARTIINFTLPSSGSIPETASFYLNLKIANAQKLPYLQQLEIYQISNAWTEGSGYLYQTNTNGPVSRNYEYYVAANRTSGSIETDSIDYNPSSVRNSNDGATWRQSNTAVSWSVTGGDYYASPSKSISLTEYPLQDLRIDVSNIMQSFIYDSADWSTFKGFIVKFSSASEANSSNEGNIKFFSKQTHTVHAPILEVVWNTTTFSTGSLKPIPNTYDIQILSKNAKETYVRGSKEKIRLVVRDKYPLKNFDATLRYKNVYYLPTSSYFGITDMQAGTVVSPGDEFAKLSCDATGSYFILDTSNLYKNRYYSVNLEVNNGSSDTNIVPELFTFLVK